MISIFSDINLLSTRIRGDQIAEYIGARRNPASGYENDVCIHVKPRSFKNVRDGDYVDFLDGIVTFNLLKDRPKVKVIAASIVSYEYLKGVLTNGIVLIPSHHINWERAKRDRTEVLVAGYIGSPSSVATEMYEEIGKALKKVGFDFVTCFNYRFTVRQDAIDLYKSVDLFIIGPWKDMNPHKIPTKVINAASFGIPTIAYPLPGYKEIEGYYVPAMDVAEIVREAKKFKDKTY